MIITDLAYRNSLTQPAIFGGVMMMTDFDEKREEALAPDDSSRIGLAMSLIDASAIGSIGANTKVSVNFAGTNVGRNGGVVSSSGSSITATAISLA